MVFAFAGDSTITSFTCPPLLGHALDSWDLGSRVVSYLFRANCALASHQLCVYLCVWLLALSAGSQDTRADDIPAPPYRVKTAWRL